MSINDSYTWCQDTNVVDATIVHAAVALVVATVDYGYVLAAAVKDVRHVVGAEQTQTLVADIAVVAARVYIRGIVEVGRRLRCIDETRVTQTVSVVRLHTTIGWHTSCHRLKSKH